MGTTTLNILLVLITQWLSSVKSITKKQEQTSDILEVIHPKM